jgi:hypothetical protein
MIGDVTIKALDKALTRRCPDVGPDDEPREQIQDGRQVQRAASADYKLCRVADPALVRAGWPRTDGQETRGHRLIVFTHRRRLEPLSSTRLNAS